MKKLLVIVVVLAFAVPCLAQTAQPAKPGPEVQKLGYLVGTWKLEAGKSSGTLTCEWFKDVFVVCHEKTSGSENISGSYDTEAGSENISVWSYDTEAKVYKIDRYFNDGPAQQAQGSVQDKTLTFDFDVQRGDKPVKTRLTIVEESRTTATLTWAQGTKADAGAKTPLETVKATKVQ
jgi:hypothetical protein